MTNDEDLLRIRVPALEKALRGAQTLSAVLLDRLGDTVERRGDREQPAHEVGSSS